jgi:hypothetical protein
MTHYSNWPEKEIFCSNLQVTFLPYFDLEVSRQNLQTAANVKLMYSFSYLGRQEV